MRYFRSFTFKGETMSKVKRCDSILKIEANNVPHQDDPVRSACFEQIRN